MSITVNKTRLPVTEWKTASGAVASVSDARGRAAKSVVSQIVPVQDLHGYSSPWPAGGGVNLLDISQATPQGSSYNLTKTIDSDGFIHFDGVVSGGGTTLSVAAIIVGQSQKEALTGKGLVISPLDVSGGTITSSWGLRDIDNGTIAVGVTNPGNGEELHLKFRLVVATAKQTTFSPYENICPISGHTGAETWDDSKYGGLVDFNQLVDSRNATSTYTKYGVIADHYSNMFAFTTSGEYQYSSGDRNLYIFNMYNDNVLVAGHKYIVTNTSKWYCAYVCGAGTPSASVTGNRISVSNQVGAILTCTASGGFRISLHGGTNIPNGTQMNETIYINLFDLTQMFGAGNEPSTVEDFKRLFPNDYYAYNTGTVETVGAVNGDPYWHNKVSWQDEAGTVYGGTLDWVSGELVADRKYEVLSDANSWVSATGTLDFSYEKEFRDRKLYANSYTGLISSYYRVDSAYASDSARWNGASQYKFGIKSSNITLNQIKEDTQSGKIAILYELATPLVFHLTPTQIQMLMRSNNFWSDTGDTSVTYAAIHSHGG